MKEDRKQKAEDRLNGGSGYSSFILHPSSFLWLLLWLGLTAWQGWMTLSLFGPGHPWERLLDDQPIVSGYHPLHLYFGYLGAQTFLENGSLCCYDPAFQAGYPKTPVFDSGSRPAELFLTVAGGAYQPAAYKVGLLVSCCLAPWLLGLAATGLGLNRPASFLATALGLLVWWGTPGRLALENGDLDLLLGGLSVLAFVGQLVRFDRISWKDEGRRRKDESGDLSSSFLLLPSSYLLSGLGLLVTAWLGWFTQPFLFVLILPLLLVYYFGVGPKHRLPWHLALAGILAAALAGNGFWLLDWLQSWWIRKPIQLEGDVLTHRTFHTLWTASLWGNPADRILELVLIVLAGVGVVVLQHRRQRLAARLLGLGMTAFLFLAVAGIAWEPLGRLGTSQLLLPALWFTVPPAVSALEQMVRLARRCLSQSWPTSAPVGMLLLAGGVLACPLAGCWVKPVPLEIGLGPERSALVETLREHTTADARILWEDRSTRHSATRWPALLPRLTERCYVGGLDPEGVIEHSFPRLVDQVLAGRPIQDWTDAELEDYCRRYDIGWAVCWSPAAVARFRAWKGAREEIPIQDEGPGCLFILGRPSYFLKGQGQVLCVNRQRIALANVVPEDGVVVLSQHYQTGMQAIPGRVQVERNPDLYDPIPFLRLRVPGPVARINVTW